MTVSQPKDMYSKVMAIVFCVLSLICLCFILRSVEFKVGDKNSLFMFLSFLETMIFIIVIAFNFCLSNKIEIPDAETVLKSKTIYKINNQFTWYESWGADNSRYIASIFEIWPRDKTSSESKLISFEIRNPPPAEGMFMMVNGNSLKISDEEYKELRSSQENIDGFLSKY